ncbi:MAG: hypothetical protein VB934_17440, partial [Polyangiaceae bacterium]
LGGVDHGELSIRYQPSRRVEQRLVSPPFEVELRGAVTVSAYSSDFAALRDDFAHPYIGTILNPNSEIEAFEKMGFLVVAKNRWPIEEGYSTKMDGWYDAGEKVIWRAEPSDNGEAFIV